MGGEIERRPEARLQRDLARVTGATPMRTAGVGAMMAGAGASMIAVGADLAWMVLAPFYVMAGVGAILILTGAASWLRQRRRARQEPPLPPARLLPP